MPYINVSWGSPPYPKVDLYDMQIIVDIASGMGWRAAHNSNTQKLILYVDNIWFDTKNLDDFVEGLSLMSVVELSCACQLDFDTRKQPFCYLTNNFGRKCVFFEMAKAIMDIDYTLPSTEEWQEELNRRNIK